MPDELFIDIETRSRVDLRAAGVYRYAACPDFGILMAGWALNDEPVRVAFGEDIDAIPGLWDPNVIKVAHNAQFERVCFSEYNRQRRGLYAVEWLPPEEWHDTMAVAAELGYPQSLSSLGAWLGGEQKDEAGTALINWFCKPDRKGEFRRPEDHPEKWAEFCAYCVQDVETHRDAHRKLGDFPTERERELYWADQRINDRGVRVDTELARAAVAAADQNKLRQKETVTLLTGVDNAGSPDQLLVWLRTTGLKLTDLKADTVAEQLARDDLTQIQRTVLELRQELALIASAKYKAVIAGVNEDGRLRGQFRFFGAHTGRWAGRGVQLHNLPRLSMPDDESTEAAILDLKVGAGAPADVLKRLVRPTLLGPFTVVDYASIEARVLAWLAGEEWAMEAFRSGRDIYVETAERMSTPGNQLDRSQGKVAVLALGYNGGTNSLRHMGAEGTDAQLQVLVTQWRRANPSIVSLWRELGDAFQKGGSVGAGLISVEVDGRDRAIRLPSGRALVYHYCKWTWEEGRYGKQLVASFRDPGRGFPSRTYGGKLTENVTQAVARDLLGEALILMDQAGVPVVGHVHDEVIVETEDVELVRQLMTQTPSWAAGLPVDGEGFITNRYRKG